MASYNFKKDAKVYLVFDNLKFKIEINSDISFSQTFEEKSSNVKTLHGPLDYFERAVINKANPGNFNLSAPLNRGPNTSTLLDWLLSNPANSLYAVDVYVDTGTEIFLLKKSVAESGIIQLVKNQIPTMSISGTLSRLTRFGASGTAIPGVLQTLDTVPNSSIILPNYMLVQLNGVELKNITSVTIELKNEVQWIENNTIHSSLYVTGASDTTYPEAFVVSSKTLSGTVQQYVTDENRANLQTWSTTASFRVRVGNSLNTYSFDCNLPSVVFTNRLDTQDAFLQFYDLRVNATPANLRNLITTYL
jgi:hypothetical protein